MQIRSLGIEIRRTGDTRSLFSEVGSVLKRAKISQESVGIDMQAQTVAHALQKMIRHDSYFCVCTIDNCKNVCGIVIPIERMNIYKAAHCISWDQMLPDYRQALVAMVLA